jgi:hypothetical protein
MSRVAQELLLSAVPPVCYRVKEAARVDSPALASQARKSSIWARAVKSDRWGLSEICGTGLLMHNFMSEVFFHGWRYSQNFKEAARSQILSWVDGESGKIY